jgi:hypothetical protein
VNVGSSIHYALGLVAAHALGLTPLVFMLAGGLVRAHGQDLRRGPHSEQLLGPTTTFVLAKRPCRIVVETGAATLADRAAGAGYPGPGGRTRDPHTTSTG